MNKPDKQKIDKWIEELEHHKQNISVRESDLLDAIDFAIEGMKKFVKFDERADVERIRTVFINHPSMLRVGLREINEIAQAISDYIRGKE